MGFELFISFLQYFEFHCINCRRLRRHVAVLLAKVPYFLPPPLPPQPLILNSLK